MGFKSKFVPEGSEEGVSGWKATGISEVAGVMHVWYAFDAMTIKPFDGLNQLAEGGFFDADTTPPLIPPISEGWQRFGLIGAGVPLGPKKRVRVHTNVSWFLCLDWNPVRSAYDALLAGQDIIQPQKLSLDPRIIIPLLFCARMGHWPLSRQSNQQARWLKVLESVQSALLPLISAALTQWMLGPSAAAARYRKLIPAAASVTLSPAEKQFIGAWASLVGDEPIQAVTAAERFEPAVIRLLEQTSDALWMEPGYRDHGRAALRSSAPPMHYRVFTGLLPLVLWRPDPPADPGNEHVTLAAIAKQWEQRSA